MIVSQIKLCCPTCRNPNDLTAALNIILPKYNITSITQIAMFMAQCGHESNDFNTLQENLNYSAEGLQKTFSTHFTTSIAAQYERQPQKIANRVYASRMGNGDELSGDGWKYRGRGVIMTTGKYNYQKYADANGMTLDDVVTYLGTLEGAIDSGGFFWKTNNILGKNIEQATKIINGGNIGIADRKIRFDRCLSALS